MLAFQKFALVIGSARPRPALIQFIAFPHLAADFLIYPCESILCTCFPNWDEFVYSLLKSGSKLISQVLYVCGSWSDCLSSVWTSLMYCLSLSLIDRTFIRAKLKSALGNCLIGFFFAGVDVYVGLKLKSEVVSRVLKRLFVANELRSWVDLGE